MAVADVPCHSLSGSPVKKRAMESGFFSLFIPPRGGRQSPSIRSWAVDGRSRFDARTISLARAREKSYRQNESVTLRALWKTFSTTRAARAGALPRNELWMMRNRSRTRAGAHSPNVLTSPLFLLFSNGKFLNSRAAPCDVRHPIRLGSAAAAAAAQTVFTHTPRPDWIFNYLNSGREAWRLNLLPLRV